jgi:HK97 family phage prohead protease
MNRSYSLLQIKSVDDDARVIEGVATSPAPDRMGDVVEPLGVKFKNPLVLLHQHDSKLPVGSVTFDKPTKDGIRFRAVLPKIEEAGPLKDRVDTAWGEVKAGIVRAVSIGFRVLEDGYEILKTGGLRFTKTEVLELSLVSVPANADAVITSVKSFDAPTHDVVRALKRIDSARAPSSTRRGAVRLLPVVSGATPARKGSVQIIPRNKK